MQYNFGHLLQEAGVVPQPGMPLDIPIVIDPEDPGKTPMEHQVTGLNLVTTYDRAGIFDEQGTGKTFIMQASSIIDASVGNKSICLMPPAVLKQFEKKFYSTFPGIHERLSIARYQGTIPERQELLTYWSNYQKFPDVLLMSYDIFRSEGWYIFKDQGYFRLNCDEARPVHEPLNKISLAIKEFLGPVGERNLLLMTGTPAHNELIDLYGFIKMLTPNRYSSKKHFYALHVDVVDVKISKTRTYPKIVGYRNLDLLWASLYAQARRVTKDQVLELPGMSIVPFEVELADAHMKAYQRLVKERILELPDESVIEGIHAQALRQTCMQAVVNPGKLGLSTPSAVLDVIDELLEEIPDKKVILFAHYQGTVELLEKYYAKLNPAVVYGKTTDKDYQKQKFINDKTCRIAICNYVSGGVGIDGWQDVCHYAICVEPTTVPGDFKQATDRLDRNGQKYKVTIYVLNVAGTLFPRAIRRMRQKDNVNESVVSRRALQAELLDETNGVDTIAA